MGLFSNYFNGNPGQSDFSAGKLPKNRIELFFSVVKAHWAQLIGLNMLYFIVFLPLGAWMFINLDYLIHSLEGNISYAEFMAHFMIFFAGAIPLITLTGPFTAGISYVYRNWARDEHAFIFSDMWDAVKQNWKQALAVSFITGLMPFLTFSAIYCYGVLATTRSALLMIPIVFVCAGQLVWLMVLEPVYTLMVTYDLRLRDLLKDALLMTLSCAGRSIGMRLVTAIVPIAAVIVIVVDTRLLVYALFVILTWYFLFGLSVTRLAYASYGNMLCDKFINPHIEGEPVNRGLRPEDDTVYIPEDDE